MSDVPLSTPAPSERRTTVGRRLADIGRSLATTVFVEPIRSGRLRLDGLSGSDRVLAVGGIVALVWALALLLFADAWRGGALTSLRDEGGRWLFVPERLLPVVLLGLLVGWLAVLWGAARARPPVGIAVAVLFLLLNGYIGRPLVAQIGDAAALRWGGQVVRGGYFAAAAVVALSSLSTLRPALAAWLRPVLLACLAGSLLAMLGGVLWIHTAQVAGGLTLTIPPFLHAAIQDVAYLLLPMVMLSTLALVDLSGNIGRAVGQPIGSWALPAAKVLLAALLALKLWIQLGRHVGEWLRLLRLQPGTILVVLASLLFFGAMAWVARVLGRRRAPDPAFDTTKERLMYGGMLGIAVPIVLFQLLFSVGSTVFVQTHWLGVYRAIGDLADFSQSSIKVARPLIWGLYLIVGVVLLVSRRDRPTLRGLGLGLVLLGGYNLPNYVLTALGHPPRTSLPLMDVILTLAVAVVLVIGWRTLGLGAVSGLVALVVFSWLVLTRDHVLNLIGRALGLSALSLVVFGILYSLLTDSSLASGQGRWTPHRSRVLIWVGYLVLSTTLLLWLTATHGSDFSGTATDLAFGDVAVPFAAWLVIARPWPASGGDDEGRRLPPPALVETSTDP